MRLQPTSRETVVKASKTIGILSYHILSLMAVVIVLENYITISRNKIILVDI